MQNNNTGLPVDPALLQSQMWVADVICAPLETAMPSIHAAQAFLFAGVGPDAERTLQTFLHATNNT